MSASAENKTGLMVARAGALRININTDGRPLPIKKRWRTSSKLWAPHLVTCLLCPHLSPPSRPQLACFLTPLLCSKDTVLRLPFELWPLTNTVTNIIISINQISSLLRVLAHHHHLRGWDSNTRRYLASHRYRGTSKGLRQRHRYHRAMDLAPVDAINKPRHNKQGYSPQNARQCQKRPASTPQRGKFGV